MSQVIWEGRNEVALFIFAAGASTREMLVLPRSPGNRHCGPAANAGGTRSRQPDPPGPGCNLQLGSLIICSDHRETFFEGRYCETLPLLVTAELLGEFDRGEKNFL